MANENVSSSMAGMSKSQLYDVMCQMKNLIEQNQQQAREILVQNPMLTKTLFQAQIMLGMLQPSQVMPTIPQMTSQPPQQSQRPVQQVNATTAQSLPPQTGLQSQSNINHSQLSSRPPQHPTMPDISNSSVSIPQTIPQPQILSSNTIQPMQQPKFNVNQEGSISLPQSTQHHSIPQSLPMHSGSQLSLLQSQSSIVSGQSHPSLQTTGIVPQPLQPPLPLRPRPPSMQPFSHPIHSQVPISAGFQQSGVPQQLGAQSMFHSGNNPSSGARLSSFPPAQPPLPSQLPPQQLYRVGGSINDQGGGNSLQVERGPWIPTQGSQHENVQVAIGAPPPFAFGQTNLANQTSRPPQLTPEMEKALLHQVMNLTPEQINLLPPEQRNQVLQLQQILR